MITLDEAIDDFTTMAKNARNDIISGDNLEPQENHYNSQLELYAKEKEQLAEWLKELKELKEKAECARCVYNCGCIDEIAYKEGYNKALYDFVYACKENIMCKTFGLRECDIEQIAEQLKAGGENE